MRKYRLNIDQVAFFLYTLELQTFKGLIMIIFAFHNVVLLFMYGGPLFLVAVGGVASNNKRQFKVKNSLFSFIVACYNTSYYLLEPSF